MAEALEEQLINPNADLVGFDERFERIVNHEWELRFNKKFRRFLKKTTLKYPQADLDETIYEPDRRLDTATIERLNKAIDYICNPDKTDEKLLVSSYACASETAATDFKYNVLLRLILLCFPPKFYFICL